MGSVRNFPVQNHTPAQTCDNERSACDLRHRIYTSNIVELMELMTPERLVRGRRLQKERVELDYENRKGCDGTDWPYAAGAAEPGDERRGGRGGGEVGEPESPGQRERPHRCKHDCRCRSGRPHSSQKNRSDRADQRQHWNCPLWRRSKATSSSSPCPRP